MNQRIGLATLLLFALPVLVFAQQERSSLPIPDPEFKGKIGRTYEESKPDYPQPDISPAGPFDRWPTGLGFDYFYGFNQGETHQYYPTLYRNTVNVPQPKKPEEGYHFTTDMTDATIQWVQTVRAAAPDKPWFCYYSTGAVHTPHHAPKEWIEEFKGQFDHGWDKQRELTHARQLEMGVIPKGTKLTPRPTEIPAWDDEPEKAKTVYKHLMETYAGFMAHTDHEVGRLICSVEVVIMTDDVGFGASSTFGGPIPTPTMDRLANSGLRYNQFHTSCGGVAMQSTPHAVSLEATEVHSLARRACMC